jgi:outer membrane biosynthesis protein TonB
MKLLLIVLLIAVIAVIGLLAARSRASSSEALPAGDDRDAITPGAPDDTVIAPPPADITTSAMGESPLPPEPVPAWVDQDLPPSEPDAMPESVPPMEPAPTVEPLPDPDPIVEPEPPIQPEPIIEPDPQPAEPEPIIEPDTQPVEPEPIVEPDTQPAESEPMPVDPDEQTDPPQAVIDAGEMPAQELDPHAGWETEEDRTIHADPESGLYHTPDSPGYKIGPDGQVFESEEEAQSAGFTRWDQPDESS